MFLTLIIAGGLAVLDEAPEGSHAGARPHHHHRPARPGREPEGGLAEEDGDLELRDTCTDMYIHV